MIGDFFYNIFITPIENIFEILFYILQQYPAYAIIAISVVMNFLALPLYMRADAINEEERAKAASMADRVARIKKAFKGDERYMVLTTYYREMHYKPIYALKSTFSLLLQIPFFIAAYNFLSNCDKLNGASFLFLSDLGQPDQLLNFGSFSINLMPIIMTLINVISSYIYLKGSTLREKIQTYGIAVIFLVLLYNSPSGLVFYWTLNQVFSVLKNVFMKLVKRRSTLNIFFSVLGIVVLILLIAAGLVFSPITLAVAIIVCLAFQTPSIISLVKKLRKGESKPVKPLKARYFVLGSVLLTIFLGVVIPLSVISASPTEFSTAYVSPGMLVFNNVCISAGLFIVWFGIFYYMSNAFVRNIFTYAVFVMSGVAILNFMVFSKDLGNMSTYLVYDNLPQFIGTELLINVLCDIALTVALILLLKYLSKIVPYVYIILILGSVCLAGVNIYNCVKEINEARQRLIDLSGGEDIYEPEDSILTLSTKGKNVMVFMMDRAISGFLPFVMNEKPELAEQFRGFTYYPNTLSFGCHTSIAAPALFGGYEYTPEQLNARDDEPLSEKNDEALLLMPTLFSEEGYEVSVCDPPYAGWSFYPPDYSVFDHLENVTTHHTNATYAAYGMEAFIPSIRKIQKWNFFMYSIMKSVPQFLHDTVYNNGNYYSMTAWESLSVSWEFLCSYSTLYSLPRLTNIVDDETNTYFVIDNETAHSPAILQTPEYEPVVNLRGDPYDNMERFTLDNGMSLYDMDNEKSMGHYHSNMAAYIKLGEMFDYMREMGVYDNTRIIVVSDHGYNMWNIPDLWVSDDNDAEWLNPLLLVKDFGDNEPLRVSDEFMTTGDVPTIVMEGLIEDPVNPFTGNPVNSDVDKTQQLATTAHDSWDIRNYSKTDTQFNLSDGSFWRVDGNVHDVTKWERVQ